MQNVCKTVATGILVVAVGIAFGLATADSQTVNESSEAITSLDSPPKQLAASESDNSPSYHRSMEKIGSSVPDLASARAALLQNAARKPEDVESLRAAGRAYHEALAKVRENLRELEAALGPQEAKQMLGMMMMSNGHVVQEIMAAEILEVLKKRHHR